MLLSKLFVPKSTSPIFFFFVLFKVFILLYIGVFSKRRFMTMGVGIFQNGIFQKWNI